MVEEVDENGGVVVGGEEEQEDPPLTWRVLKYITAAGMTAAFLYATFFLAAIVSSKEARSRPYNVYLIFLVLPDAVLNAIWAVASFYAASNNGEYPFSLCLVRNASTYFYYYANLYLNAVVGREVFHLVLQSYRRQKTPPPPIRYVLKQVLFVYIVAAVVTVWSTAPTDWSIYTTEPLKYCDRTMGSKMIPVVWATLITFLLIIPPMVYVVYLFCRITRERLLPSSGRTRAVFIYFFRIIVIFFAFYLPNLLLAIVNALVKDNRVLKVWANLVFSALIPLQCYVTIRFAYTKEDIAEAMNERPRCFSRQSAFFRTCTTKRNATCTTSRDDLVEESNSVPSVDVEVEVVTKSEWKQDDVYPTDKACLHPKDVGAVGSNGVDIEIENGDSDNCSAGSREDG